MHPLTSKIAIISVWLLTYAEVMAQTHAQGDRSQLAVAEGALPDETYASDLAGLKPPYQKYAAQIQQRLQSLDTNLRLVAMIPGLARLSERRGRARHARIPPRALFASRR